MSNIRQFQTVIGQMVMGDVVEETDDSITIKHPLDIRVVPQGNDGEYGLKFIPHNPINPEGRTKIFKRNILSETLDVPEGMVNLYVRQTTSIQIITALDQLEGKR